MQHYNEDNLLKYQLELLDGDELINLRTHLDSCQLCQTKLADIKNDVELISSYDPDINDVQIPIIKNRKSYAVWLKRAAVLLVGFVTGYSTSVFVQPDHVVVVGQYLNTAKTNAVMTDYTVCPSIDIYLME